MGKLWRKILNRTGKIRQKVSASGESLSGKATRGTFWVFALRIIDRLFRLLRIIILARLLAPGDFGIFGVSLLVLSIVSSFSQTGYIQALIQKKENISPYLDTAWTVRLLRHLLIAVAVFFLAGPASSLFDAPGVENIIRVISITIVLEGFGNIAVLYFQKELKFHKWFRYQFISTVVDFTVTVVAAYLLRSVWALVIGLAAGMITRLVASYLVERYRPRFRLIRSQVKELFSFGRWIFGSSILIFFIIQGDDILVGSVLGATMLGFYQMAYRISNTPTTETTLVITIVTFPLYSKLQDNTERLREAYLRVLQFTALLSFPLTGIIISLAPEITTVFLGEQWMPIVPAVQVLALAGLFRSIITTAIPVFRGVGKPGLETRWQVVRLIVIIALIYPLTIRYGILGTSISIAASAFVSVIGFSLQVIRLIRCRVRTFLKLVLLPLANALLISLSVYILKYYIDGERAYGLIILSVAALSIFFAANIIFDRFLGYGVRELLKKGVTSFIRG